MFQEIGRTARGIPDQVSTEFTELRQGFGEYVKTRWHGKDHWNEDQVRFVHEARRAARRALYFVRLVEPDEELLDHGRQKALRQLDGLKVPEVDDLDERRKAGGGYSYAGAWGGTFEQLVDIWELLPRLLGRAESWSDLRYVEECLAAFIRRSEPYPLALRWNYVRAPAALALIRQHMGFLAGVAAVLVVLGVEAVRSLLFAHPGPALLALLGAAAPGVLLLSLQGWQRSRGGTPFWDRGGRAARALAPAIVEPEAWVSRHPDEPSARRTYLSLLWKVVLYVALWALLGLGGVLLGVTGVAMTIYVVVALLGAVILAGSVVDFADIHSEAPLRIWLLAGTGCYLLLLLGGVPSLMVTAALILAFAVLLTWAVRVKQATIWPFALGILFLALGVEVATGSRRARDVWAPDTTRTVVPYLDPARGEWPFPVDSARTPLVVMAASGGGSRAAIYTAHTLEALQKTFPDLSRRLEVVSSVSGGSLANAAWVTQRLMGAETDGLVAEGCRGLLSERVDADFLRPTLLGVLPFMGGRGRRIEETWRRCPGLGDVTLDTLKLAWRRALARGDSAPPFPIPLFNSVMLHRHAVVLSPLDRSFYATPDLHDDALKDNDYDRRAPGALRPTWVVYRSGVYGLDDLLDYDPRLTQSVRASANFPFGFPLVEVRATEPLPYSPYLWERVESAGLIRLTDGGTLSNSGMWSLFSLLMAQRESLRGRPILLIIVEASRMPGVGSRNRLKGLIETIQDKHPKGENLHHRMLESLGLAFGPCFRSVQVDLPPVESMNVYTTWALDRKASAVLDTAFHQSWDVASAEISDWEEQLSDCGRSTRPARVPVS